MTATTEFKPIVKVGYEYTVNLGNFENVKVHVEVTDVARGAETVSQAYDRIDAFVTKKVSHEVAEAKSSAVR